MSPLSPLSVHPPQASAADSRQWEHNLHVYFSPIQFESRIFKITRSLVRLGLVSRVTIVGIRHGDLPPNQALDQERCVYRPRLLCPRVSGSTFFQLCRVFELSLRVFLFAVRQRVDLVNCHMLFALPVCVLMKYLLGIQVIYDAHEIETEQEGFRGFKKRLLQFVERHLLRHVDMVVQAGRSYADWYKEHYDLPEIHVLKNVPLAANFKGVEPTDVFRKAFGISPEHMIFLYQGMLLEERGVPLLLQVFATVAERSQHVVFMGYGPLERRVQEAAAANPNIHFHPAVPPERLRNYTAGADVGFSLPLNTSLNNYLCNPNKTYEYLLCGVPMIVSPFPELLRFIAENEAGWAVEPSVAALTGLLKRLNRTEICRVRERMLHTRGRHGWEKEEETLERIYRHLLSRCRGAPGHVATSIRT